MSVAEAAVGARHGPLPDGWRWVRLGDVSTVHPGQHILESDYTTIAALGTGYLTGPADFGKLHPTITKWTDKPKAWCQPGDVLLTVKGAGVGKVNIAPDQPVAIGRQLMAIRPRPGVVDMLYLLGAVRQQFEFFQGTALGSTVPGLARDDVEGVVVPLPPLPEQRRIASILTEQMAAVDRAKAAVQAQLEAARALPAAYLRGVFPSEGEPLPNGWRWQPTGSVGEVKLGRQRSPKDHWGEHMHPYLRVANVFEDRLDVRDVMSMNFSPNECEVYRLRYGDILLTEGQSEDLVGRPAMYRDEVPRACFQNTLVRFRPAETVLPEFALLVFRSFFHTGRFRKIARRTVNIAHLGAERLAGLKFPLPPLGEQQEIVGITNERNAGTERLRSSLQGCRAALERMPSVLLRTAFGGKL